MSAVTTAYKYIVPAHFRMEFRPFKERLLTVEKAVSVFFFMMAASLVISPASACSIVAPPDFTINAPTLEKCYFNARQERYFERSIQIPPGNEVTDSFEKRHVQISSNTDILVFLRNKTALEYGSPNCDNLVLSEEEQEIFRNIINEFNKKHGPPVIIEKQSDADYLDFKKEMNRVNADKCDCKIFPTLERYDGWTLYVKGSDCGLDSACNIIPPEGCPGRVAYDLFWSNPFSLIILGLAIPIAAIFGIIFSVRFVIRKFREK